MSLYQADPEPTNTQPLSSRLLAKLLFPSRGLSSKEKRQLSQQIAGKTILITGASFGIGEQLAYLLASLTTFYNEENCQQPPKLILVGRTQSKLEQVQARINQTGAVAIIYALDLRDEQQLQGFIDYLTSYSVDIFVNNAGQSIRRSVMKSLERAHDYERTILLNYLAPVKLSLSLIPQLRVNHGQLINVSALNVLLPPMPEWSAYQASKTAFDQWLCSVTPELAAHGISTSTLYLPLVRTRMIAPTAMYQSAPAMTPEQVAAVIGRLMVTHRSSFKPWWLYPVEVLAVLIKKPLALSLRFYYQWQVRSSTHKNK